LLGKFGKGTQVFVEGSIKSENYRDKNGVEVSRKKIKAHQVQLLGSQKS
jgi:single-stranded DNA-binding protein